jgi:hypothetical protein
MINDMPFWVCPAGTVVPSSLGVVSTTLGTCGVRPDPGGPLTSVLATCEQTEALTSIESSCIGSPVDGWIIVADGIFDVGDAPCYPLGSSCGSGCHGQCAVPHAPL